MDKKTTEDTESTEEGRGAPRGASEEFCVFCALLWLNLPPHPVREAILFRRSRIKRLEGALFKIHLTSPLRGWMPSAFALQVYGVTGRQQDGATLQQEIIKNSCSGKAGFLSVSQRSLRESSSQSCPSCSSMFNSPSPIPHFVVTKFFLQIRNQFLFCKECSIGPSRRS